VSTKAGAIHYLFESIQEVQDFATRWLWTYNNERPNMALSSITPMQLWQELLNLYF
jgi:transposase InsO family protein